MNLSFMSLKSWNDVILTVFWVLPKKHGDCEVFGNRFILILD